MVVRVQAEEFIFDSLTYPVLDVRSPGEFIKGHIPGAISFPLFSDSERAEVGTLYKEMGKEKALDRGLELVEPKVSVMYKKAISYAKNNQILVHCWRGGKRSESVAWLLSLSGIEVKVLEGGYKFFRRWAEEQFEKEYKFRIIGGKTGSGKTEVLQALKEAGAKTIDLEFMADHRGSAFGRLGATREVTQQQFENDLALALHLNEKEKIWIEDESRGMGKIVIPGNIWSQMRNAMVYYLEIVLKSRKEILLRTYGNFSKEVLAESIMKIAEKLGGLRTQEALKALEGSESEKVIEIMLEYYDKMYEHGLSKRKPGSIRRLISQSFDAKELAFSLLAKDSS